MEGTYYVCLWWSCVNAGVMEQDELVFHKLSGHSLIYLCSSCLSFIKSARNAKRNQVWEQLTSWSMYANNSFIVMRPTRLSCISYLHVIISSGTMVEIMLTIMFYFSTVTEVFFGSFALLVRRAYRLPVGDVHVCIRLTNVRHYFCGQLVYMSTGWEGQRFVRRRWEEVPNVCGARLRTDRQSLRSAFILRSGPGLTSPIYSYALKVF